jgi:hypothetical protein
MDRRLTLASCKVRIAAKAEGNLQRLLPSRRIQHRKGALEGEEHRAPMNSPGKSACQLAKDAGAELDRLATKSMVGRFRDRSPTALGGAESYATVHYTG